MAAALGTLYSVSLMEDLKVHRALKRAACSPRVPWPHLRHAVAGGRGDDGDPIRHPDSDVHFAVEEQRSRHAGYTDPASFGTFLGGSFVLPIYSIALTLFYYDQRIRKEGYDVEWLMEQAAVSLDDAPAATSGGVVGTLSPQTERSGPAV